MKYVIHGLGLLTGICLGYAIATTEQIHQRYHQGIPK